MRQIAEDLLSSSGYGIAVRSSAVCEDADRASFAGVFESHLGVLHPDDMVRRVRDCWCSLWSPAALRYGNRLGVIPGIDGMAVIVQSLVPASCSGVLHTAQSSTGNPWIFELSAVRGLSLDLMAGSGTGDTWTLDWETGCIKTYAQSGQRQETRATPSGLLQVADSDRSEPAISPEEIVELTAIGRQLDDHFNTRLDIEWAFTEEALFIVQARPLTGLPDFFPEEGVPPGVWHKIGFVIPGQSEDLPYNLLVPLHKEYSAAELWYRYHPDDMLLASLWREEIDIHGFRYYKQLKPAEVEDGGFEQPHQYEAWLDANESRYRPRWDRHAEELLGIARRAKSAIQETQSAAALVSAVLETMDAHWDFMSFGWSGPQSLGRMCESLLTYFVDSLGLDCQVERLLGEGDSRTLAMTRHLQELGRSLDEVAAIRAFSELSLGEIVPHLLAQHPDSKFLANLECFCWQFGEIPPSWSGRPLFWDSSEPSHTIFLQTIKHAWLGTSRDVDVVHEHAQSERLRYAEAMRQQVADCSADWLKRFDKILAWTQYWTLVLNERHGSAWRWEREIIWQLGVRLNSEGRLEQPEHVLLLYREDLEQVAESDNPRVPRDLYLTRKREWDHNRRLSPPQRLGAPPPAKGGTPHNPGETPRQTAQAGFKGTGMCGGRVQGRARHFGSIFDPGTLDALGVDDILVLQENVPGDAGWHGIFTLIGGIVVSRGQLSHHLIQIARECALPLVCQIEGDLGCIPDGARVQIDGRSGEVELI